MICAGGLHHEPTRRWLKAYGEAGGKIFLIGGEHRGLLGPLSKALGKPEGAHFPVTARYGRNNTEYIDALRIRFVGELAESLGQAPMPFVHNPDTKAGWQKPKCLYAIVNPGPDVRTLSQLVEGDRVLDVAGIALDPDSRPRHAFIPEYLVSPYLLTNDPPLRGPSRPMLDTVGRDIVKTILHLLAPDLLATP